MSLKATFYRKPNGKQVTIAINEILEEDEKWFNDNNISVSLEEGVTSNEVILYGDTGMCDEESECPIESILIWDMTKGCEQAMTALRKVTQELLDKQ